MKNSESEEWDATEWHQRGMTPETELNLNNVRSHLEKVMLEQPPESTDGERKHYLAGVIDTFSDFDEITEPERDILYVEYCF